MNETVKVPLSEEILKFDFPAYEEIIAGKALKFYLYQDSSANLASIRLVIRNGALNDSIAGMSSLISKMLMRGTSKFSAEELATRIESLGTSIKTSVHWDDIVVSSTCLTEFFQEILDYILDVIFDSVFPDEEFTKLQKLHLSNLSLELSDIGYLASTALNSSVFKGGYELPLLGTKTSVQSIGRDILFERYKTIVNNSEYAIILTGNFDEDKTMSFLNNRLTTIKDKEISNHVHNIQINKSIMTAAGKDSSNQSSIRLANKMINYRNPDLPYAQIANTIFGGFFLSRLNKILREEKGYTYGISSVFDNRKLATILVIASSINIDKTNEAIHIIIDEYKNLKENPVSEDEVKRAVRYILGSFLRSNETPQQIASLIQSIDINDLSRDFYLDFYTKTANATIKNVRQSIEKYFVDMDFVISAAGNLKIIEEQLKEFGKIDIFEIN